MPPDLLPWPLFEGCLFRVRNGTIQDYQPAPLTQEIRRKVVQANLFTDPIDDSDGEEISAWFIKSWLHTTIKEFIPAHGSINRVYVCSSEGCGEQRDVLSMRLWREREAWPHSR